MNPLKYAQMMKYLTRAKKQKPDLPDVFSASQAPIPEKTLTRNMFKEAQERFKNAKAGGGMLVQPGFGGTRQGYKGKNLDRAAYKEIRPITQANIDNYAFFTSKEAAKPYKYKVQLPGGTEVFKTKKEAQAAIDAAPITNRDYTEGLIDFKVPKGATNYDKGRIKIPTGEFIGEGRDKSQIFKIQNKDGSNVKYMASGTEEGKKFYNSIEEVKKAKLKSLPDELVKVSSKIIKEGISEVTYKNKKTGKIVKYYKPRVGESKETIPGKGATSLKKAEKFIKDYYVKNPKPVRDPQKSYATKDRRNVALQETDPTKATGTKKYNYHHIRQIAGGVPLTSDDVAIINQRINSKIGGEFNETLNRISSAIRKNNRLALEAMNAKEEGLALEYMKRSDDLNAQAEKIVNSAIDKLPKKYKGYVGFNQFTLPRDEYGLPISNEPMIIRKVGGMPVSKDAIDLTTLDRKDAATFRKIVKQQAERGQTGQINKKQLQNLVKQIKAKNVKGVENALKQTGVKGSNAGFISRELLESAAKGIGNVSRVLAKYGILPEVGFLGGDYLVRTQLGDSPKEAFLRASDFYRPGDQTKEAEILETSRFFGDKAGQLVGRVIDYEKQLAKIENLKQQKQSLENLTPTSNFSYLPDTSQDIKNIDDSIKQATIDLNNKFNMTEAERTYANRIREETDDARMATSNVAKTRLKRSQSPNYRMSAPQAMKDMKSQTDLDLNMFPSPATIAILDPEKGIQYKNLSESSFEDLQNYRQLLKDFNVEPPPTKLFLGERDRLRGMLPSEAAEEFGAEQAYGASGTFFGQPLAGGGIAKIAGVDQGPPPESGPNSQGLKGLFNRVKRT